MGFYFFATEGLPDTNYRSKSLLTRPGAGLTTCFDPDLALFFFETDCDSKSFPFQGVRELHFGCFSGLKVSPALLI